LLAKDGDYLGQSLQEIRADLKAAATGATGEVREAARGSWTTEYMGVYSGPAGWY